MVWRVTDWVIVEYSADTTPIVQKIKAIMELKSIIEELGRGWITPVKFRRGNIVLNQCTINFRVWIPRNLSIRVVHANHYRGLTALRVNSETWALWYIVTSSYSRPTEDHANGIPACRQSTTLLLTHSFRVSPTHLLCGPRFSHHHRAARATLTHSNTTQQHGKLFAESKLPIEKVLQYIIFLNLQKNYRYYCDKPTQTSDVTNELPTRHID
jgi:hypothetical protein